MWTAVRKEAEFLAYRVAMPRHRLMWWVPLSVTHRPVPHQPIPRFVEKVEHRVCNEFTSGVTNRVRP